MVRSREGFTLLELIAVLAVMGAVAGVVGVSIRLADPPDEEHGLRSEIRRTRLEALHSGRPIPMQSRDSLGLVEWIALPDGSVVADHRAGMDRLSGTSHE